MNRLVKYLYIGTGLTLLFFTASLAKYGWFPEGFKNDVHFLSGTVAGFFMLAGYSFAKLTYETMRGKSSRIIAQNAEFIYNPEDQALLAGKWMIQPIGGILVKFINIPSSAGAVIAPLRAFNKRFGRNAILRGKAEPVAFLDLDQEVKDVVTANRVPGPYYISRGPIAVELRGTDYMAEQRKTRIINRDEYAEQRIALRSIATADEASRRLAAQMGDLKKPVRSRVWDWLKGKDEKQEPPVNDQPHQSPPQQ